LFKLATAEHKDGKKGVKTLKVNVAKSGKNKGSRTSLRLGKGTISIVYDSAFDENGEKRKVSEAGFIPKGETEPIYAKNSVKAGGTGYNPKAVVSINKADIPKDIKKIPVCTTDDLTTFYKDLYLEIGDIFSGSVVQGVEL